MNNDILIFKISLVDIVFIYTSKNHMFMFWLELSHIFSNNLFKKPVKSFYTKMFKLFSRIKIYFLKLKLQKDQQNVSGHLFILRLSVKELPNSSP